MKIIGIGLSRSGSTTLAKASRILGLKSAHYPHKIINEFRVKKVFDMGDLDVVFDVDPWFPNLYIKAYPECKIIWYSRNYEDWIISCRKYFGSQLTEEQKRGCYEFFGNYSFNHVKFTSAYFAHIQMMIHFNNTVPVLKIMPCDEDPETCKKNLSTFLNKSWPDSVPWPHENKS